MDIELTEEEQKYMDSEGTEGLEEEATETEEEAIPEETTESAPTEEEPEEPVEEKPDHTVPLASFLDERNARQEADRKFATLAGRFEQIEKMQQKQAAPEPEVFDRAEDPAGYLNQGVESNAERVERLEAYVKQQEEQAQRQQQYDQLDAACKANEAEFTKTNPDYENAAIFLRASISEELKLNGYAPQQIEKIIQNETAALAFQTLTTGINTAQRVYDIAKSRGYQPPVDESKKSLETVAKGVSMSKPVGKSSVSSGVSAETVASMTDEEFSDFLSKNKWSAVAGN